MGRIRYLKELTFHEKAKAVLCSRLFLSLISTYLFAFIAHAYGFLHNSVGHDSITHFYSGSYFEGINLWKIQLGRWFVPIYRGLVSGYLNMPWLISIIAFFWIALSVFLCIKMFRISNRLIIILLSAIMVVNITISTQIATYIFEFDVDVFALLLSVFAAYLLTCSNKKYRFIICGVLLTIVLGIYQSYISAFLVLVLFYYLLQLLRGKKFVAVVFDGLKLTGTAAASGVAYILMCRLFCVLYKTELETASGNSLAKSTAILDGGLIGVLKRIVGTYQDYFRVTLRPVSMTPFHIIDIITIALLVLSVLSFIFLLVKKKTAVINKIFSIILFILIPFAANFACFFSGWTHSLTHYAFSLTLFIELLIVKEALDIILEKQKRTRIHTVVNSAVYICLMIIIFNGVKVSNMIYTQRELNFNATLSQMTIVSADLRNIDGFDPKKTKLSFVGTSVDYYDIEPFDQYKDLWAVKPCVLGSHTAPYYFKYILDYPLNVCGDVVQQELQELDEVKNMPSYPSKGYIQYVDDYLVLKLSDYEISNN